jgi:dinuclear metal center YbgI/SA1388 family protein
MNKYEIIKRIEIFAPPTNAESWDCVGFMIETQKIEVSKIMLCLTPTSDIIRQAHEQNCDMIISHHPMFFVGLLPKESRIDIYSAHTNLDKAKGGTTDTIISTLNLKEFQQQTEHEYLRFVDLKKNVTIENFSNDLKKISPNLRYVNNKNVQSIRKVAFCAGSGAEFIKEAQDLGAEALVTGDLKFHTALDSEIVLFDIGHFESEILVLPVLEKLIGTGIEIVYAKEKSPFNY